jgi:hypothetical protein
MLLGGAVCALALAVCATRALSQEEGKKAPDDPGAAMMEAWMKAGTPGDHHQHLEPYVGRWNATVRWRMGPEAPWEESTSTAEFKWILGGRYLQEKVTGEMEGAPFEGLAIIGYDNITKKHFSLWMDNMITGVMTEEGTCDQSGKVLNLTGAYTDPTGQKVKSRSVSKIINNNKLTIEMFHTYGDKPEFLTMEITYTRA